MNNKGFEKLAEVLAVTLVKDYYKAALAGNEAGKEEASIGLHYWEQALPMPADEIIEFIDNQIKEDRK